MQGAELRTGTGLGGQPLLEEFPTPQAVPAQRARARQPQSYLPFMKPSRTRSLRSESQ